MNALILALCLCGQLPNPSAESNREWLITEITSEMRNSYSYDSQEIAQFEERMRKLPDGHVYVMADHYKKIKESEEKHKAEVEDRHRAWKEGQDKVSLGRLKIYMAFPEQKFDLGAANRAIQAEQQKYSPGFSSPQIPDCRTGSCDLAQNDYNDYPSSPRSSGGPNIRTKYPWDHDSSDGWIYDYNYGEAGPGFWRRTTVQEDAAVEADKQCASRRATSLQQIKSGPPHYERIRY